MGEPIENLYFNWLCAKVLDHEVRNYHELMRILHRTEFVWVIPSDQNRAADGVELRTDFLRESRVERDLAWESEPCSMLEFLIALAKRAEFQTDIPMKTWFWEFMNNLRLDEYRHITGRERYIVEDILHAFIWRQYDPSGYGGLFPISRTHNDQRQIEVWYQLAEYLKDRGLY